jgi:hypothetical protein
VVPNNDGFRSGLNQAPKAGPEEVNRSHQLRRRDHANDNMNAAGTKLMAVA